jgi:hypothetical protein
MLPDCLKGCSRLMLPDCLERLLASHASRLFGKDDLLFLFAVLLTMSEQINGPNEIIYRLLFLNVDTDAEATKYPSITCQGAYTKTIHVDLKTYMINGQVYTCR